MGDAGSFEGHKLQKMAASRALARFKARAAQLTILWQDSSKKAEDTKGAFVSVLFVLLLKIKILPPTIIIYDVGLHQARDMRYQALPFFTCNNELLGGAWGQG